MSAMGLSRAVRLRWPAAARTTRRRLRRGMSLLEVMFAVTLLLACVMALSRVAYLARRHAVAAEDHSLEQTYCQNIIEELLAGVRPLSSVSPEAFEGGDWVYMVEVEGVDQSKLTKVTVTVDHLDDPEGTLPTEDEIGGFRLVRWLRAGQRVVDTGIPPSDTNQPVTDDATEGDEPPPGADDEPS